MALDISNIVPLTHYVKASDITQFYDLLTGAMTDQPVTLANTLSLTKAGTALSVTHNATIGGTLTVTGNTVLGTVATGSLSSTNADATAGQVRSLVNGAGGGFVAGAGSDVNLYRSAADEWTTDDALVANAIQARWRPFSYSADGALAVKSGTHQITKAGVCNLTLAAPTAGTDDGTLMIITAQTANAHVVTGPAGGFDSAGAGNDVATFGGAIGDSLVVVAVAGTWNVLISKNIVFS